jgi:hypothetical protein
MAILDEGKTEFVKGEYDDIAAETMAELHAKGVVLVVLEGSKGTSFSVVLGTILHGGAARNLPLLMEYVTQHIRADFNAKRE